MKPSRDHTATALQLQIGHYRRAASANTQTLAGAPAGRAGGMEDRMSDGDKILRDLQALTKSIDLDRAELEQLTIAPECESACNVGPVWG